MEESRLRKLKDEEDWTAFENGDAVATDSGKPAAAPAAGAEGQSDNSVSPSHPLRSVTTLSPPLIHVIFCLVNPRTVMGCTDFPIRGPAHPTSILSGSVASCLCHFVLTCTFR